MHDQVKIAIVGAGVAGLGACWKLKSLGFNNVTIYEGTDRIGGRINTVHYGNGVLEIGAQWVHGEEDNLVYEFAQSRNLLSDPVKDYSVEGRGHFVTNEGRTVNETLVKEVIMALDTISENVITKHESVDEVKGVSVGALFQVMFRDYLNSKNNLNEETISIHMAIYNWYLRFLVIDNCCDSVDNLSVAGSNEWVDCPGVPLINFKNGFSSLVESLISEIELSKGNEPNKPVLILNKSVSSINWALEEPKYNCKVLLRLSDGATATFDHVLVTSSIGYLKENVETMFHPPLPKEKIDVMNVIGFGTVNKIYLVFQQPFWDKNDLGFQLLWLKTNQEDTFPSWTKGISGFDIVRGQPNVLVGWIGGERARDFELVEDDDVLEVCWNLLQRFLGKIIEKPVTLIRSKWHSEKFTRGAYCHRLLGYELFDNPMSDLLEPLYANSNVNCGCLECLKCKFPVVFFAGEATDEHFFSSVHGALQSGFREARRISSIYEKLNLLNLK